jgi:glycosyltransferase involved in cell wall biosynthesis
MHASLDVIPGTTPVENNHPLRVCYFGTYRAEYSRNRIMIEGLRRAGVQVVECHEKLWKGIPDRVEAASGGWLRPAFWWQVIKVYLRLLKRHQQLQDYDVMVVGYPGQLDVFLARILSRVRRKPLVWDVFMSIYLIAVERGLEKNSRISVNLLKGLERRALSLPDLLIQDTRDYVDWFQKTYGIAPERFRLVPTGADDRIYRPQWVKREDDIFRVVYYGTFIPNHGIDQMITAASLLADDPSICFTFIGDGPERSKAQARSQQLGLKNIEFLPWMEQTELASQAARADVILGAFGTTPQSLMTVQNKIFEGLAMGKAVITGESPAVRAAMRHGEHVFLCERENPSALAEAILTIKNNPKLQQKLSENGYNMFKESYDLDHIGHGYTTHLCELIQHFRASSRL